MAFAADGLALACGKRCEEFVEAAVAGIFPVELLVGALQESDLAEEAEFRFGREGDMNAGGVVHAAEFDQAGDQRGARFTGLRAGAHQEPAAGGGRKRHRDLELRVIAAAGAHIGFRPTGVEDVFAARVTLEVARRGGKNGAVDCFDEYVLDLPAGPATDRFRGLQGRKKMVR